ncbi:hypothetical protein [Ruegeria sp. HU-ET01832]|uniref:hypothetical protein n=1 Tax=Ruegeria sp. HU-ET01832 TaxID=3135906 RepID=UPI00333EF6AF
MSNQKPESRARLYRLHFRRRTTSATSGMIWANAASWVFRQTPKPRHAEGGYTGFEIETLQHPIEAKLALEKATGGIWEMHLLQSRPAESGEGEGICKGENPWKNGWPESDFQTD